MTRRLLLGYLAMALFVLLTLEIPLGITFARSQRDRLLVDVERDAVVVASLVEDELQAGAERVDPPIADYTDRTDARIVVTDEAGISVYDSVAAADASRRDFSTRPEISEAITGQRASGVRASETLGGNLLYVAVPVASGGSVHGAVRITYPTSAVDRRVLANWLVLGAVAVVVLGATAAAGSAVARWVTRPTRELETAAAAIGAGDLAARAPVDGGPPELRALARRFNRMADQLDGLVGAQRAFVADASHQLRSPLTALRLELEDLDVTGEGEAGRRRALAEANRLGRLVDELLVLARAEGGDTTTASVDVAAVAADRVATWQPLAEESGVALSLDRRAEPVAQFPADQLDQVLDNLLANALEAVPTGGHVTVVVDVDDTATVRVVDDGPGLSPPARDRAFDRFWRGPDAEPGTGSGLGLPIARRLLRAAGGDLSLADAAPGVEAIVSLPLRDGSAPA